MKNKTFKPGIKNCNMHGYGLVQSDTTNCSNHKGKGVGRGKASGDTTRWGRSMFTAPEIYYNGCDEHGIGYGAGHPRGNSYEEGYSTK